MAVMAKNMFAVRELEYFKFKIESEFFGSSVDENFIFYRYELPKLDVAASHMFAQAFRSILTYKQALDLNPYSIDYKFVSKIFFINLIPRQDRLIVVIGHVKGIYGAVEGLRIDALGRLPEFAVVKLISDILVRRIDTWAMSIELYERLVFQDKISQYLKLRSDYFPEPKIRSFFKPYHKYPYLEMPLELAQSLREANLWELWRFMVPFNMFDGIV